MKKIIAVTLFAGLFSTGAFAGGTAPATGTKITVTIADGYNAVGTVANNINIARQVEFTPRGSRAGFVKNPFEATLSANVIAGVSDNGGDSRMGVVAGSNKGYNVFTGSSVGGSVSQCGDSVAKTEANLGASLVVTGTLDLDEANGCGR